MKKPAEKKKKKKSGRKRPHTSPPVQAAARPEEASEAHGEEDTGKQEPRKTVPQPAVKKEVVRRPEKKKDSKGAISRYASMAVHFFKEARIELKKVKWPTRKELLASTAMVIFLALLSALYLGIVDFGLIKIIRLVIG